MKWISCMLILFPLLLSAQVKSDLHIAGEQLLKERKFKEGIPLFKKVMKQYEDKENFDSLYFQAVLLLSKSYMHSGDSDSALVQYHKARDFAGENEMKVEYADASNSVVSILVFKAKLDTAEVIAREMLSVSDLPYNYISNTYTMMGRIYNNRDRYDSAYYYYQKAVELDSIKQDSSSISFNYMDLGTVEYEIGNYEPALEKILTGKSYLRKGKDEYKLPTFMDRISAIYFQLGNMPKSLSISTENVALAKKYGSSRYQSEAYMQIGQINMYYEEYDKALKNFALADSVNNANLKDRWMTVKARYRSFNAKMKKGIGLSEKEKDELRKLKEENKSDRLATKIDMILFVSNAANLSRKEFDKKYNRMYDAVDAKNVRKYRLDLLRIKENYYREKGLFGIAYNAQDKISAIIKEQNAENNKYTIQELDSKYLRKEQDQSIALLDAQNQAKEESINQQRKALVGAGVALALISFLLFFMWRLFRIVKGQKAIIEKALSEKDILLREIHHRVKNNLQLVSSLLTLQSRSINDETALQAIQEGKARVRSMALIHQDLYNKENLTGINTKEYLEKLTAELFHTYNTDEDRIALHLDIMDVELDVDTLVPLGLIINELVTNALKYAFADKKDGKLSISLKTEKDKLLLDVFDNGVGYDLDDVSKNSFGSTLISALTGQLDGEMSVDSDNGTHVSIAFSDYKVV